MNTRFLSIFAIVAAVVLLCLVTPAARAALSSSVQVTVASDFTASLGLSNPRDKLNLTVSRPFGNGTDTAQADLVWHDSRTLTSGANESLDLAGTLTDAFGTTVTFAKVKSLVIENTSASMTITIGGAAANGFATFVGAAANTIVLPPLGVLVLVSPTGFAVTAGTADLLKITNSSGSSTVYRIWINGSSQ